MPIDRLAIVGPHRRRTAAVGRHTGIHRTTSRRLTVVPTQPIPQDLNPDETLADRARRGNNAAFEALTRRYTRHLNVQATRFFFHGGDADDIRQEGLIGLYKAVRDYRPGHFCGFRRFAELCVTRQIICAVKAATRGKRRVLDTAIRLDAPTSPATTVMIGDTLAAPRGPEPAHAMLRRVEDREMLRRIQRNLSPLEYRIVIGRLRGDSYEALATSTGRDLKAVDNALQRAKKKLQRARVAARAHEPEETIA